MLVDWEKGQYSSVAYGKDRVDHDLDPAVVSEVRHEWAADNLLPDL